MRILIISHEYPPIGGGGANACMNLSRKYAQMGHEVHIVTVMFDGQEQHENNDLITIHRIKAKRAHAEHCSFSEMMDFVIKAFPYADKLEKTVGFDICQIFFGIPSGPIGYRLKKKYKLPYVIRFGGGDIPGFQERFKKVYRLIGPAIRLIWKKADALVANSSGLKRMAEGFYNKKEILVIPNGADVNAFSDECGGDVDSFEKDPDTFDLLFVSRLIERKGLQDVIPQLKDIKNACGGSGKKIVLNIVGDGPYRETLEKLVVDENLGDTVVFHGQKNKKELPRYYRAADVFLFPSRKEGMPNAVLEAMSYGLPIVMTPCEGSDELIQNNGFAVEVGEFADKISYFANNEDHRKQCSEESRRLISEVFSWDHSAAEYTALFEKIMAE